MRESSGKSGISRSSKRLFIKRDKEGVASTVGTLMALLVFLAFLGIFTNSYVPLWMLDNERAHMNEVMNQFGEFKSKIDSLIIGAQITGQSGITMYAPITLGSDGVPIFASQTFGQLTFSPHIANTTGVSIEFTYKLTAELDEEVKEEGGGSLELYCPNRYFEQQWVQYENGAIIIKQIDGQTIRAKPSIEVSKVGDKVDLSFTQIDFLGTNSTVAGAGSVGLNINLVYLDIQNYEISGDNSIEIVFTTMYAPAWYDFLETLCIDAALNESDYDIDISEPSGNTDVQTITWVLHNCGNLNYNKAFVMIGVQV